SWEFTPNPPLNDGDHDFTIIVTDPAGNASEESDPYPVNIDTTAPVANAIAESMSKDSGANHTDFLTNDGTRGRLISGSLTAAISADERVQVSLDGGKTWQDAILNGSNSWSFVDDNSHTADWEIQTRVVDKAGNVGTVSTQDVTLDTEAPDAPDSFSINGSTVTVQFDGSSLKAGDTLQIIVGDKHFDQALTQAQIDAGSVDILAPGAQMTNTSAAFIDQVGNVSQSLIFKLAEVDFESATPERVEVNAVRDFGAFTFSWGNYANETAGWPRGIIASGVSLSDLGTAHSAGLGMWSGGSTNPSLTLNNGETATQASFSIGGLHVDKTVSFYDADNHLIHSILVATKGVSNIQTVDVPMPAGQEFARIEFKGGVGDWFWLDDIQFTLTSGAGFQHVDPAVSQVVSESAAYNGGDEDNIFSVQDVTVLGGGNTHINAGSGLDTLKLTGKDQVLDLTQLGEKISSIEVIDLTGSGNNTLNLSLSDVLEQGTTSLFTEDDHVQMMVKGNAGDTVNLDELLADGTDPGNWANSGQVTVGGVEYEVYRHDALDAELLVQQGVQTNLV
ncbi:Ig-like domain-containing protein, partial [Pseudomonas fluorescens]